MSFTVDITNGCSDQDLGVLTSGSLAICTHKYVALWTMNGDDYGFTTIFSFVFFQL
jgi:hypothetical protein